MERAGIPVSDIRRALGAMGIGVVGVLVSSDICGGNARYLYCLIRTGLVCKRREQRDVS